MRNLAVITLAALVASASGCSEKKKAAPPPALEAKAPDPAAGKPGVDERRKALDALLKEQWEYRLRMSPEFASIIGDRRYNDRWSDSSLEAVAADLAETKKFLARFEAIDTAGLVDPDLGNQQLMVRQLREQLDDAKFEGWLMPINQMSGPHLWLAQFVSLLRFTTVKDYEDYIARLDKVPTVFDQTIALMEAGLAKKLMPPKEQLLLTVGQTEKLAANKPDASPFAKPVEKFPDDIAEADRKRLRAAVLAAIEGKVLPSYKKLAGFLKDKYAPAGRADAGVWALPDGAARYAAAIKNSTTIEMPAEQIHELGLKEVARIEAEQEAIGKQLGFKDLATFRDHIRKDKKFYAKDRKEIIDRYQKATDEMYAELPKLFGRLPKQKMTIEPTEAFREKEAAGAEYISGAPDGSRLGKVSVNTSDPTKRLWVDMESTAYHEGVPGHHMQITIQQELQELPPFRQYGGYTAFFEGWALYSEALGKEVGFFKDPYSDYGRLQDELLRAIRLVVDTGVHHKKWTRQQMVDFFHEHSSIDEPSVQNETSRYIVWPGQALAYKIGQLTIRRLRDKAQQAQGAKFDIRAFHDHVLSAGALPLDVLEKRIDAWIAATPK